MKSQSSHYLPAFLLYTTLSLAGLFSLLSGLSTPGLAQSISVDGSTSTLLNGTNDCVGNCNITDGLRDGNGSGASLFHSFGKFNIDTGAVVTFEDPGVENIFGRVTGNSLSNIDGTLKVDGSANLFLLNPNGIIFGENASLDLEGSFLSSTAESILFENGVQFSASDSTAPSSLLTISTPIGLQFGNTPAPIQINGAGHNITYNVFNSTIIRDTPTTELKASEGQTLAFLGGNLVLDGGNITAETGHIELGALGSNDFVKIASQEAGWNFDYSDVSNFQDIQLSESASLDVSGSNAGSVQLQGQEIKISEGSIVLAQTETAGGGQVALNASKQIALVGEDLSRATIAGPLPTQGTPTGVFIEIASGAEGDASSLIDIKTPQLDLTAGAQIGLGMAGAGTSGNVNVSAQNISLDNGSNSGPSLIYTAVLPVFGPPPGAVGQGGDLAIETDRLSLTDGAQIVANTFGAGNAGSLTINARDIEVRGRNLQGQSLIASSSEVPPIPPLPSGSGNGGTLTIRTERLSLEDVGQISVATKSNNPAGDLQIRASDYIELSGGDEAGRSGLFASALLGSGSGGNIEIETDQLRVLEGATINASNFPSFASSTVLPGTGSAGNIDVSASSIEIKDSGFITANTVSGDHANITLNSDSLVLRRGGSITTNADGSAAGGNINIDTEALIAFENSDITANAVNNFGGRVVVNAETILGTAYREQLTPESDITASSALGREFAGEVKLNTPETEPADGLATLPTGLVANDQITAACDRIDGNTFVATGRGGAPEDASQLVTGQSIWNDFRLIESDGALLAAQSNNEMPSLEDTDIAVLDEISPTQTSRIVEARSWERNGNGQVVLGENTNSYVSQQLLAKCLTQHSVGTRS